jgi:Flp pilus assembly protein TadG
MKRLLARLRRSERGAAVVEAAFVLPVLMIFMLGAVDLAQWNFQKSAASSGARDGAREAILGGNGADCGTAALSRSSTDSACSTRNTAIRDAIAKRLGRTAAFTYRVTCLGETTTTSKVCNVNSDTVDRDRIEIEVTWQRPAMTFVSKWIGASSTVTATSRMTITG